MTTGYVACYLEPLHDASGTINNPATPETVVSSGSQPTNGAKVTWPTLLFDQSTDEHAAITLQLPGNWASGGTLRIKMGAKVTSGNVIVKHATCALTDSSTDSDAAVYGTVTTESATAVPGTVGHVKEVALTLDTTGWAAKRYIQIMVGRDADNGSDTAAGDMVLLEAAVLEYTTT